MDNELAWETKSGETMTSVCVQRRKILSLHRSIDHLVQFQLLIQLLEERKGEIEIGELVSLLGLVGLSLLGRTIYLTSKLERHKMYSETLELQQHWTRVNTRRNNDERLCFKFDVPFQSPQVSTTTTFWHVPGS